MAALRDITGRSSAQFDTRRLAAIIESSDDAIIAKTLDGVILSWNAGATLMFGYAAEEMIGHSIERLIPAEARREEREVIAKLARGERVAHYETTRVAKQGHAIAVSLGVSPLRDAAGVVVGASEIARDISERKHAEARRDLSIARLVAAHEESARFARAASHDLREPLRIVRAFCGRLRDAYGERLDERGREYLSLAVAAASRMNGMLDDLLDFDRVSPRARGDWFDSREATKRALANLEARIRDAGGAIELGPLPRIHGNAIRFERLMQNLIGNALKFVAPGVTPRISVRAERDGEFWRFRVADNGIGVDPRFHDRIFEPFKRLHSRDRYDGVGLGLTICRKIVEGFGGALGVESREGEGSTFSFTVRAEREEEGSDS